MERPWDCVVVDGGAGDVCTRQPHVPSAVDSGSKAAMSIVQSLLAEDVGLPFPA